MRPLVLLACVTSALLLAGCAGGTQGGDHAPAQQHAPGERVLAFVGGLWFTGTAFEERTAFAVNGILTFVQPAIVDSTIHLAGGYVVPPFGEAHNHNVEHSSRIMPTIGQYLQDGVFYVKNPNNLPRTRHPLAGTINVPTSIDAAFANGGLTSSDGHPIPLVRRNIERGIWTKADGEGAFYFAVDDEEDLDRVWPGVLDGRPDFLKTYLLYSEEYAQRKDDPAFLGWKGLDPALLPEIVRRAHQAGLRVSAHVETAADFHHALFAGVDEVAHMPGFRGDARVQLPDPAIFEISEADARLAARLGTVVVTTVGGVREMDPAGPDGAVRRQFDRLHARNLGLLREHGVRLALGSDSYGDTSVGEAMYLHSLGVLDNLALLKLWSEVTPQAIFPERALGCLQEGCEASFLVLRRDPIADFGHVRDIVLRVKQGRILGAPSNEPSGTAFAVVNEADRLSERDLWPGFDPRAIPVAIYDGERTLLFRHPSPPAGFEAVSGRDGVAEYPGRYPSVTANSSAEIGGLSTATLMLASDTVSALSQAGILIHEAFHVYQREHHPGWQANEVELFTYPSDDPELLALRRMETEALRRALGSDQREEAACWGRIALDLRSERFTHMPPGAAAYERGTEWNEGLATYVERRAVDPPGWAILPEAGFAPEAVRQRAYEIGTSVALLLDRFSLEWRMELVEADSTFLDALLSAALPIPESGSAHCELTPVERERIQAAARADVDLLEANRADHRSAFLGQPGWTLVFDAAGVPLFPQGFDPMNVQAVSQGEVLHTRWLRLGNETGAIEVLGRTALTESVGDHPLFNGVRSLTVAGLGSEPTVTESNGTVTLQADGVDAELRGATVERSGQTMTVRLPRPR